MRRKQDSDSDATKADTLGALKDVEHKQKNT